jgi:hypothetical protein
MTNVGTTKGKPCAIRKSLRSIGQHADPRESSGEPLAKSREAKVPRHVGDAAQSHGHGDSGQVGLECVVAGLSAGQAVSRD